MRDSGDIYTVIDRKGNALATAKTSASAKREANAIMRKTGKSVAVAYYRKRDGQHAALNQNGDHAITGVFWNPELVPKIRKTSTKKTTARRK